MADATRRVVVGRISRAHGIRGELAVEIRTDEPERRFAVGTVLHARGRTLRLTGARRHQGRLLVRFEGVDDRTAAEAWHGTELEAEVDASDRPEDDDEFYDHQLIGLQALAHDGESVGRVSSVVHTDHQDLLVIDTADGEALVPFVAALVPEIDLDAGLLRLADIPGLLDLDAADSPDDSTVDDTGDSTTDRS